MAKDITLLGTNYPDVPAVTLPQTGGGTATFYDEVGSQSITENGTYDVSGVAQAVVNVSGGGGGYTETLLWENPSPTSQYTYNNNIMLIDEIYNYDFLKAVFRVSISDASNIFSIADVNNVKQFLSDTGEYSPVFICVGSTVDSGGLVKRPLIINKETGYIGFAAATAWFSSSTKPQKAIPVALYGIKIS